MPSGLSASELKRLDEIVSTRKKVRKSESLFRSGDTFNSIYAVRTGTFKTRVTAVDGRDQVTGFQLAGDILGLDGMGSDRHMCDAVAIENAEVCVIEYERLDEFSKELHSLQTHLHRIMSREITRDHGMMMLLGSMRAEERVAAFLLNILQRQHSRGFSGKETLLRMTREEIGSYLGLKLETVSRTFSRLQNDGIISVDQKQVSVLDMPALQQLAGVQHT